MSLPLLPSELQDLIVTNLHPTAVIALSQTNRYYHSTVSLHRLAPDAVRIFLQNRSRFISIFGSGPERYACYKCLCLKPAMSFSNPRDGDYDRQCLECDLQDGRAKPGGIHFSYAHKPSTICVECLKARDLFCRGCDACASCLEKKGVEFCVDCGWCYVCVEPRSLDLSGLSIGYNYRHKEKLCRGCGSCASCLERKGIEFCAICGSCDPCMGQMRMEIRKRKCDHDALNWAFFNTSMACPHHILEHAKTSDLQSHGLEYENEEISEDGLTKREDEHEEIDANQEDNDDNGKEEERASKDELRGCSIGQTEN